MTDLIFASKEHESFYNSCMDACRVRDEYHRALFFVLGACAETRANINSLFDFNEDTIRLDALERGWQTGGTMRLCRLAFNLWNGFDDGKASPYDLFDCSFAPYMLEGVRLRYPEYCRELKKPVQSKSNKRIEIGG